MTGDAHRREPLERLVSQGRKGKIRMANSLLARRAAAVLAVALAAVALASCMAESRPNAEPASTPTRAPAVDSSASASPSSSPSTSAENLPEDCARTVSAEELSRLITAGLRLNDPGFTMLATQQADLLDLLTTVPTVACTWGPPGTKGIASNISSVDEDQSARIRSALEGAGFGCDDEFDATVCRIEQRGVSLDDQPYVRGEVHALRGGLWVAASWLNVDVDTYVQDVLSTVPALPYASR